MAWRGIGGLVGIALFLFGVGALDCKADDSAVSRATLAGLQGVRVIVEEPQPNIQRYAEKYGLTRAQVQADVERRLQQAGIRTVQGDEWLKTPGRPLLYVNINTHETEKYWYAYDIRLELRQLVLLEANPKIRTMANTWSVNITGVANIGNLNVIKHDVGVFVDRFIAAYKGGK